MAVWKIAVLVGSLRRGSYSRMLADALIEIAPDSVIMEKIDIGSLPLYNQDFDDDGTPPPSWTTFRDSMRNYDAVLFVTPEYNRSVPGVLKNALDVGSRPYGKSIWGRKPGAVISISSGALGGFGANHHLRQTLVSLNVPVLQQPEAYIGNIAGLFSPEGKLTNEGTGDFLQKFLKAFITWIDKNAKDQ